MIRIGIPPLFVRGAVGPRLAWLKTCHGAGRYANHNQEQKSRTPVETTKVRAKAKARRGAGLSQLL
jgi:hypothetical protein